MPFTSETARIAGSKPKKAKIITEALVARLIQADSSNLHALCDKLIQLAVGGDISAIREIVGPAGQEGALRNAPPSSSMIRRAIDLRLDQSAGSLGDCRHRFVNDSFPAVDVSLD